MRPMLRFIALALLLTALTALFYLHSPAQAAEITLLTADGPQTMLLEDYLPGALAAEMPALFPEEALKAQAVAIRSYALAASPRHENADLCTQSSCCLGWLDKAELEALWGEDYTRHWSTVCRACEDTRGQFLSYGGQAALAVFHASSAGQTQSSGELWSPLPYLISVASPETGADVPNYESTVCVPLAEAAALLGLETLEAGPLVESRSGRVASVRWGATSFTGEELRTLFALRSTAFRLEQTDHELIFTVLGNGHGVGMSQYGAKVYAELGLSYREILAHYYPGTSLVSS